MEELTQQKNPTRRKFPWGMIVVAALFVIIPFLSWYGSWFGRQLSDEQIETYINDDEKPRNIQHALNQIVERMEKDDSSVKRWYPKIISLSSHPVPQVREFAAWAMGHDNTSEEFHRALLSMLEDENSTVRGTAALWLVRFNDDSGRPELVRMLRFTTIRAEASGIIEFLMKEEGLPVMQGAPLARIKKDDGQRIEIRAAEAGRIDSLAVSDESRVEMGTDLMVLSPTVEQVWESLRALYLVGRMEDAPFVERYTRPLPGLPDQVQKQAAETMEKIRSRAK
ncbi:MAG: HEAT repeat domain-containing protein [Acidobacteriota bacterium]